MVVYPALTRSTVVKRFEFDDVRYTVALLIAMAHTLGVGMRELPGILAVGNEDIADLMEDAPCNHALPFGAAVEDMLARFGVRAATASIPSFDSADTAAEMPALLVELIAFNSEYDEPTALYALMSNGTLDWLDSDDFKSLPVPLNQLASEQIDQGEGLAA